VSSFSPEKWNLIPCEPSFGSLLDVAGGRLVESYRDQEPSVYKDTDVGMVKICEKKDGCNIMAEEMGIGLFYEKSGRLSNAGLNVYDFSWGCSMDDFERMGGEALDDFLDVLKDGEQEIFVNFNFKENSVAIVNIDKVTKVGVILAAVDSVEYSQSTAVRVAFDEYYLYVGFTVVEDEFRFGLMVTSADEGDVPQKTIMTMSILNDCNYQTFLDSPSRDKHEKLVRRVFLL
jgi:hypothetical protein